MLHHSECALVFSQSLLLMLCSAEKAAGGGGGGGGVFLELNRRHAPSG